jgi:hypothetical protein
MKRILLALATLLFVALSSLAAMSAGAAENPYGTYIGPDAILFHDNDTGNISIWIPYDEEEWQVAIAQTDDELDDSDTGLIASHGNIDLYKLATGEYQVNNGPDAEGKVHVVVFDENFNEISHYTYSVFPVTDSE